MPKKIHKIDRFEGGLVNNYNKRDIPENSLFNAVDVMVDVEGRVRMMGRDSNHAFFSALAAKYSPGYGFFVFNADYSYGSFSLVEAESSGSKLLLIQGGNSFHLYDNEAHLDVLELGSAGDETGTDTGVIPEFFYADGAVRICDAHFQTSEQVQRNGQTQWFGPIKRVYFPGHTPSSGALEEDTLSTGGVTGGMWVACDQEIFAPDSGQGVTKDMSGVSDFETLTTVPGLNISVGDGNSSDGSWESGSKPMFAYSWLYDGKPGSGFEQESKLHTFTNSDGTVFNVASGMKEDSKMYFRIGLTKGVADFDDENEYINWFSSFPGFKNNSRRITGFRVYWSGDAVDGTDSSFDDPFMLLEGYFGSSSSDTGYIKSFENERHELVDTANGGSDEIYRDFVFESLPSLTYELLNGYKHDVDSIYARYKTSCIANGRLYAGNIYQDGTLYRDRMIKSPVFKYDILPSTNYLDVATQDGDIIIKLVAYADRILQFKRETLYIINVSGEFEYVEATHRFMGVSKPYAVAETEWGIVWVNRNGCYLYDGNSIENLIDNKMRPNNPDGSSNNDVDPDELAGWSNFISDTGMVGYIPDMKQLIIFEDPANPGVRGDIMIYDIRTKSWTRGIDRISTRKKTNVLTNYDNTCMFGVEDISEEPESFDVITVQEQNFGTSGIWLIQGVSNMLTFDGEILKLGSNQITGVLSNSGDMYGDLPVSHQSDYLAGRINSFTAGALQAIPNSTSVVVTRENVDMSLDSDAYTGELNFYTSSSGAPTSTVTTPSVDSLAMTPLAFNSIKAVIKPIMVKYSSYSWISGYMWNHARIWCLCLKEEDFMVEDQCLLDLGWQNGQGNPLGAGHEKRYGDIIGDAGQQAKVEDGFTFKCKSAAWTSTSKTIINANDSYVELPIVVGATSSGAGSAISGPDQGFYWGQGNEGYSTGYDQNSGTLEPGWRAYPLALPDTHEAIVNIPLSSVSPFSSMGYSTFNDSEPSEGELASHNTSLDTAYSAVYGEQGTLASPITIDCIFPSATIEYDGQYTIHISGYTNINLASPASDEDYIITNSESTYWDSTEGKALLNFDNSTNAVNHTVVDDWGITPGPIKKWSRYINFFDLTEQQQNLVDNYNISNGEYPNGKGMLHWGKNNEGLNVTAATAQVDLSVSTPPVAPKARKISLSPSRMVAAGTSELPSLTTFSADIFGENGILYDNTIGMNANHSEFDIINYFDAVSTLARVAAENSGMQLPWASDIQESYTVTIKTFNNASTIPSSDAEAANAYFLITNVDGTAVDGINITDYILGFKSSSPVAIRMSGGSTPTFDSDKIYKVKGIKNSLASQGNGAGAQINIELSAYVAPDSVYELTVENSGSDATITGVTLEVATLLLSGTHPANYPDTQIGGNATTSGSLRIRQFKNDLIQVNDNANLSSFLRIETKDFDLGQPSIEKVFYKVEMTTAFEGELCLMWAANNGDTFNYMIGNELSLDVDGNIASSYTVGDGLMKKYTFYFHKDHSPIKLSNNNQLNSMRFKIKPNVNKFLSKMNLNDISIHYRDKSVR